MLDVATKEAENPVSIHTGMYLHCFVTFCYVQMSVLANRMNLKHVGRTSPQLSLPGKLMFPSANVQGHFAMLGLGDIVYKFPILPMLFGINKLICFRLCQGCCSAL